MVVTRHQSRLQQTPRTVVHASQFEEMLMATKAEYFCSRMNPDYWKQKDGKFSDDHHLATNSKSRRPAAVADTKNLRPRKCSSALRLTKDSIPVTFLAETSIHGVKYIAQEKRHWVERLFWITAFVLGVLASVYLIYGLLDRYNKTPVIVTFDVNEENTNAIPFPAVTICFMNMVSRSLVLKLKRDVDELDNRTQEYLNARHALEMLGGYCNTHKTFYKEKGFAFDKDEEFNSTSDGSFGRPNDTIVLNTMMMPCGTLIKACKFGGYWRNCTEIFKPTLTSYGRCCTFNMLPLPLLLKHPSNSGKQSSSSWYDNPMLGSRAREHWNQSELDLWGKWDYDKEGIDLALNSSRPHRQNRAGRHHGLSFDLAFNSSDHMCSNTDSEGFQFTLHSPLEKPQVKEYSSVVHMGKEIFVEVSADVTKADVDIRGFPQDKRKCVFGDERQLILYRPYTRENCIEECTARVIITNCSCAAVHMPNHKIESRKVNFCLSSSEQLCVEQTISTLQDKVDEICPNCDPLCEEIKYTHQTTMAKLKPVHQLIRSRKSNFTRRNKDSSLALLHIFFVSERTVPKIRKSLYGIVDLIASAGGILGLCLGFSVLSGIELIYFFTLRPLCKHCRLRRKNVGTKAKENNNLRLRVRPAWDNPVPRHWERQYINVW